MRSVAILSSLNLSLAPHKKSPLVSHPSSSFEACSGSSNSNTSQHYRSPTGEPKKMQRSLCAICYEGPSSAASPRLKECRSCKRSYHTYCLGTSPQHDNDTWQCEWCLSLTYPDPELVLTEPKATHLYEELDRLKNKGNNLLAILRQIEINLAYGGFEGRKKWDVIKSILVATDISHIMFSQDEGMNVKQSLKCIEVMEKIREAYGEADYDFITGAFTVKPLPFASAMAPPIGLCKVPCQCGFQLRNLHTFCVDCGRNYPQISPSCTRDMSSSSSSSSGRNSKYHRIVTTDAPSTEECTQSVLRAIKGLQEACIGSDPGIRRERYDCFGDAIFYMHNFALCAAKGETRNLARKMYKEILNDFAVWGATRLLDALEDAVEEYERIKVEDMDEDIIRGSTMNGLKAMIVAMFVVSEKNLVGVNKTLSKKLFLQKNGSGEIGIKRQKTDSSSTSGSSSSSSGSGGGSNDSIINCSSSSGACLSSSSSSSSNPNNLHDDDDHMAIEDDITSKKKRKEKTPDTDENDVLLDHLVAHRLHIRGVMAQLYSDYPDLFHPHRLCSVNSETHLKTLPTTMKRDCGHCLKKTNPNQNYCKFCKFPLKPHVDYEMLIDWMMWSYLGVLSDLYAKEKFLEILKATLRLLPLARSYQPPDAIGHMLFIKQCYFVTHLVLLFADYGQRPAIRCLFQPEWDFFVKYLPFMIKKKDYELVGEFLQGMKILQYDAEKEDEQLVQMFDTAKQFLFEGELRDSSSSLPKGEWPMPKYKSSIDPSRSTYIKYHTCFCVAVGLNDFSPRFLLRPTQPHVFEWVGGDVTREMEEEKIKIKREKCS